VFKAIPRFDRRLRWVIVAPSGRPSPIEGLDGSRVRIVIAPIRVVTARRGQRRIAVVVPVR
jgi:hypothetical protein